MNRFKISNALLHNCDSSVYSISNYFHARNIININNLHVYNKLSEFSKRTLDNCLNNERTSTIVSTQSNTNKRKAFYCNRIKVSCSSGSFGTLRRQNFLLLGSRDETNNYKTIRRFSDSSDSSIGVPATLRLDGVWKDLSECAAVEFCQDSFVNLHAATGLPWWATIVLATWGVRTAVTLPLALYQSYIVAKVENLKLEMNDIVKELKMETNYAVHRYKWTEKYARAIYNRSLKKQWQKLIERENCHPMKSAVVLIFQIPMWIVISASLRNLCYMLPHHTERAYAIYLELTTGGFGWVTNLTTVDQYYVIPIALGLLNLTIIELQNLMRSTEPTKTQRYLTNFFRLFAIAMVPLASFVPAGMSLYWTSSSAFGIIQNLLLMSPRIRRLARIPPTDHELEEPYRHLYQNLRRKIGLKEISRK